MNKKDLFGDPFLRISKSINIKECINTEDKMEDPLMKKLLLFLCCFCFGITYANDTIPIINTVFHGINTVANVIRQHNQVVIAPQPIVPVQQVVTVQEPVIQQTQTLVQPTVYYINGQYYVIENGRYVPYVVPIVTTYPQHIIYRRVSPIRYFFPGHRHHRSHHRSHKR